MDVEDTQYMDKSTWYDTTMCTKFGYQSSKFYFKTGRKDRCDFMCYVDKYVKDQISMPGDASSGGGKPMPSM